ncbi:hypothetical protein Q5H92_24085 [Hymenobacter sp. M29]|uniref:Uncharacterized protein n=1 Tax=Hymenobacter mellowenesis TaxID=3063995 RepID=A0ABT9AHZ8_9BACT|nr:hypothetical protein [Hymenobacter sp. M29]MDO7849466.1 hypothetical protein [Hymenobacter sp. M29]
MRPLPILMLVLLGSQAALGQDYRTPASGGPPTKVVPIDVAKYMANARSNQPAPPSTQNLVSPFVPSDYLFVGWTQGLLQPYGNGAPQRAWLKYNAFSHQLISRAYVRETEVVKVVDMDLLREFTIGDSLLGLRLTYRRYLNARVLKASLRSAFYEVHYDAGKTALLCQRSHTRGLPQAGAGGFSGSKDILSYFLKTPDNRIVPVNLRPAEVLAALGAPHATAATTYAQQQQLDLHRENDVVRLLAYCDTL